MSQGVGVAVRMPGGSSWKALVQAKHRQKRYRITLVVRGRTIVKLYDKEDEFRKWRETYEAQHATGGIESMEVDVVRQ